MVQIKKIRDSKRQYRFEIVVQYAFSDLKKGDVVARTNDLKTAERLSSLCSGHLTININH